MIKRIPFVPGDLIEVARSNDNDTSWGVVLYAGDRCSKCTPWNDKIKLIDGDILVFIGYEDFKCACRTNENDTHWAFAKSLKARFLSSCYGIIWDHADMNTHLMMAFMSWYENSRLSANVREHRTYETG